MHCLKSAAPWQSFAEPPFPPSNTFSFLPPSSRVFFVPPLLPPSPLRSSPSPTPQGHVLAGSA
eukprot:955300-Rhodomonas_salina.1